MSTTQATPDTPPPALPLGLEALADNPKALAYGLLVLAAGLLAIPIVLSILYGSSAVWVSLWGAALAGFCALGALYLLGAPAGGQLTSRERVRLTLLTLGGTGGFITALLGLILPFTSTYYAVLSKGMLEWRKSPLFLVKVGLALVGGLVLMFLSLQLARGLEHSRAALRRLLYGYNAVLSSLLLLIILVLVNILSVVQLPLFRVMSTNFDWTHSKKYTLDESFRRLLESVKDPIQVYAFVTNSSDRTVRELTQLLDNCRSANSQFSYTFLSRDLNISEVEDKLKKFNVPEPDGLLVIYGNENDHPMTEFIKREDLGGVEFFDPQAGGFRRTRFNGENALYKTIDLLSQGKSRPIIYFTQGNGEMEVARQGRGEPLESMSALFDMLGKGNYTPRELRYDGKEKPDQLARRLLEEGSVVVVARPTKPLPPELISGLREYLKGSGSRRGKLLVLLAVVADPSGKMIQTGLEPLLAEYKVKANDDRLISPATRTPRLFGSEFAPDCKNPIAQSFRKSGFQHQFVTIDARSLDILPGAGPGPNIQAEPLLVASSDFKVWSEPRLNANIIALVEEYRKNGPKESQLPAKPLVVAATVSEGAGPRNPMDFHAPPPENAKPVMVVFGDAGWVSDVFLHRSDGWSLFNSCLVWLRERPDTGVQINPRTPETFTVPVPADGGVRLLLLPGALMILSIIGLGVGVWVVRRR